MLFRPPKMVTVMEPWDGMRLLPAELFRSLRGGIAASGQLSKGRLDLDALDEDGAIRWCAEGDATRALRTLDGYLLGVKWPAYWRYLELLPTTKFLVCLRDPVEVITSFRLAGGRVGRGLQYDTKFNRALNSTLTAATSDTVLRRILLFDYIHERILPHLSRPNVHVVRYERWFDDRRALLDDVGAFLGVELADGPVRLRPSQSRDAVDPAELHMIRAHCSTAEALGYTLAEHPGERSS